MCNKTVPRHAVTLDESGQLDKPVKPPDLDNYAYLEDVLASALKQASHGKGKKRHACGEPFEKQIMLKIEAMVGSFTLGQAIKKIVESDRMDTDAAIRELYGAIVYIAGRIIHLETGIGGDMVAKQQAELEP